MKLNIIISVIILLLFSLSCKENNSSDKIKQMKTCERLQQKYDSLLIKNNNFKKEPFLEFFNILKKEKNDLSDTVFIRSYESLLGRDSLLNYYIKERIHTIRYKENRTEVLAKFRGKYNLKPVFNKKYAQATSVIIKNDSCFVYKYDNLIESDRINFINSSSKMVKGKFRIKNFRINLIKFSTHKIIFLEDNGCMDCERLEFYKVN